jgi:predicted metal-dependent phosphotriesterase family hydrolase
MTRAVQTVTGPVDAADLGVTLVHEHLLIDMYEPSLNSAGVLLDEALAVAELAPFRAASGATLVEQTTLGLHPDWDGLRRISLTSGIRIVAGTGVYWRRFRPAWVEQLSEAELRNRFVSDLRVGVGAHGVRAGLIGEIATGHRDIDATEARVLRAAAAAQAEVGTAIATHALFTNIGLAQLDILEAAGADPAHVAIGHADTCPDMEYHRAVLKRGAWLAFDTVGQLDKASDGWRADRLAELSAAGYLGRLLVSSDVCKRPSLRHWGGPGYAHVLSDFVPRLTARGFTAEDIQTLLVGNPARLLG